MLKIYSLFALDMINVALYFSVFQRHIILLGGSYSLMGLMTSTCAVLSLIWKPVAGHLSDTIGHTKVLMFCLTFSAVGNILTVTSTSLSFIYITRIICVMGSPIQSLIRMIITDIMGPDDATKVFNQIGAMMGISFLAGTIIGGRLSEFQYGISYTYVLMSLHSLISLVLVISLHNTNPYVKPKTINIKTNIFKSICSTFTNLKSTAVSNLYWHIFVIKTILDFSNMIIYCNNKMILRDVIEISEVVQSYTLVIFTVFATAMNLLLLKIKTKYYSKDTGYTRIFQATLIAGIGCCLLAITRNYWLYLICFVVTDLSKILLESSLMEVLLSKINNDEKGMVLSSYDSIFTIAEIIVPVSSGIIADLWGPSILLLSSGALYLTANRITSRINVKKFI